MHRVLGGGYARGQVVVVSPRLASLLYRMQSQTQPYDLVLCSHAKRAGLAAHLGPSQSQCFKDPSYLGIAYSLLPGHLGDIETINCSNGPIQAVVVTGHGPEQTT